MSGPSDNIQVNVKITGESQDKRFPDSILRHSFHTYSGIPNPVFRIQLNTIGESFKKRKALRSLYRYILSYIIGSAQTG